MDPVPYIEILIDKVRVYLTDINRGVRSQQQRAALRRVSVDMSEQQQLINNIERIISMLAKMTRDRIIEFARIIYWGAKRQCQLVTKKDSCDSTNHCVWGNDGCIDDDSDIIPPLSARAGEIEVLVNLYNEMPSEFKRRILPEIIKIGGLDYGDRGLDAPLSSDSDSDDDDDQDSETKGPRQPLPKVLKPKQGVPKPQQGVPKPKQDTPEVDESLEHTPKADGGSEYTALEPLQTQQPSSCRLGKCFPAGFAAYFGLGGGIKRRNKLKKIKSKKLNKVKSKKRKKIKSKKLKKNKTYKKTRRKNK